MTVYESWRHEAYACFADVIHKGIASLGVFTLVVFGITLALPLVQAQTPGITALVSVNDAGINSGNGFSGSPVISADGRFVVFRSFASDLAATDTNGTADVFVFEVVIDPDGDGIPDDQDQCVDSGLSPTVVISLTVANTILVDGCTIMDLINETAEDAETHGDFVSAVANLLNILKKDGVITGKEKGRIQSVVAQAEIP